MNNIEYNRTFIASSELFSGFKVIIDIRNINTLDDIINIFIDELKKILKKYNFEILLEISNNCKFHIHTHTLEYILTSNENEIFYMCDHC